MQTNTLAYKRAHPGVKDWWDCSFDLRLSSPHRRHNVAISHISHITHHVRERERVATVQCAVLRCCGSCWVGRARVAERGWRSAGGGARVAVAVAERGWRWWCGDGMQAVDAT